jgi:hypothetical protein
VQPATDPKIALRQVSLDRDRENQLWHVGWEVENRGDAIVKIVSARLPHGQFRAAEQFFKPELEVAVGKSERFQSAVRCEEPAGLVTENAFVIFHCEWRAEAWRLFVRIRVTVNDTGMPDTATESITTQKVGFSGISN